MSIESPPCLPAQLEEHLPLEKSWYARIGLQDLITDNPRTINFLTEHEATLSDDLRVIRDTSDLILRGFRTIPVGEGGTWARLLAFASAKYDWGLHLVKSGTLKNRPDEFTAEHLSAPVSELLQLNHRSSQLATAAILCGSNEPLPPNAPYHLRMTYEARGHWRSRQGEDTWEVRRDSTYRRQAVAWLGWLSTGTFSFDPIQPEDYLVGRVFGIMTRTDAEARGWHSLQGHESNRFDDSERAIAQVREGEEVALRDHRMLIALRWRHGYLARIRHEEAISKSWQWAQFRQFCHLARTQSSGILPEMPDHTS